MWGSACMWPSRGGARSFCNVHGSLRLSALHMALLGCAGRSSVSRAYELGYRPCAALPPGPIGPSARLDGS